MRFVLYVFLFSLFVSALTFAAPTINSVVSNMSNFSGANIYLIANVSDSNLTSVNFTVTAPDGTAVVNNVNGTNSTGGANLNSIWNSSTFTLSQNGTYNFTVSAIDRLNVSTNFSSNISFIILSLNIDTYNLNLSSPYNLTGLLNLTNGTAAANTTFSIYLNGTLQFDYGDGLDGNLTVTTINRIINNYTSLSTNVSIGASTITVTDATAFAAGDDILIIQVQNGTAGVNSAPVFSAGAYEFAEIASKSSNDLTLTVSLSRAYYVNSSNTTNATVTQIVRVPNYTNVTIASGASITAPVWNGSTGGIVVFRAVGLVNVTGTIDVNSSGFRGGNFTATNIAWSGESFNGLGIQSNRNNFGGGGGAGSSIGANGGGAGGGYGTNGTNGTQTIVFNGTTYGSSDLTTIHFGSGGGGGSGNINSVPGGIGGGIVFIIAKNINVTGFINASGENRTGPASAGSGGGGAGGTIYLVSENISVSTNTIRAYGGPGGSSGTFSSGAGGGGRIRFDFTNFSGSVASTLYGTQLSAGNSSYRTNSSGHYRARVFSPTIRGLYPLKVNGSFFVSIGDNVVNITIGTDTSLPLISISVPANNSNFSSDSVVLNFTITDDITVASCWYSINNGTTNTTLTNCANTTITPGGGIRYLTLYANDSTNNVNTSGQLRLNVDLVSPSLTVGQPLNNSNFSSNSVALNYSATDNLTAINTCWYSLDNGTSNTTIASCANTTITPGGGLSYVTIYTNDTVNRVNSSGQLRLNVDLTSPSITVQLPANNSNFSSNSVALNYSATDNLTAINTCWYSLDNGVNTTVASCANTTLTPGGGRHNITVYANDTVNNVNTSSLISFAVDLNNPSLNISAPANNSNYSSNSVALNFVAGDNVTGINTCWYSLTNGTSNTTISSCSNTTITPGGGLSYITITVNDSSGNQNSTGQLRLNIDLSLPAVAIQIPSNTMQFNATNISLNFTATDNLTSINSCWYNLDNLGNTSIPSCNNISIVTTESSHTIIVYANDSTNNVGNSSLINFTISLPVSSTSSSSGSSPKSLDVALESRGDSLNGLTFAACKDDVITFTADPAIADVSARLILYEPYEGLQQQTASDQNGIIMFDMQNEKEGIYQLNTYRSSYLHPYDIFFKFIHCSGGKIGNTKEKEDAIFALLKAQDAITIAKQENRETLEAERILYDAQALFDKGNYTEARDLAIKAERLAKYGKPRQIIIEKRDIIIENDTTIITKKQEEKPPTEQPKETPGGQKPPKQKKLATYTVTAEVYNDTTIVDMSFSPEKEFEGTLRAGISLDFQEYKDGIVKITSPTNGNPSNVVKGSILAYWDNIRLLPSQNFRSIFTVAKELTSEEILSARIDFVDKNKTPLQKRSSSPVPSTPNKTAFDYILFYYAFIFLALGIILTSFIFWLRGRRSTTRIIKKK